jgi:putative transposase
MARRKQPAISDELLDQLLAGADPKTAFAKDGLLDGLKKAFAERALNAEIDHHLNNGEENTPQVGDTGGGQKIFCRRGGALCDFLSRGRLYKEI